MGETKTPDGWTNKMLKVEHMNMDAPGRANCPRHKTSLRMSEPYRNRSSLTFSAIPHTLALSNREPTAILVAKQKEDVSCFTLLFVGGLGEGENRNLSSSPSFVRNFRKILHLSGHWLQGGFSQKPLSGQGFVPSKSNDTFRSLSFWNSFLPKFSCRGQHPPVYEDRSLKPCSISPLAW